MSLDLFNAVFRQWITPQGKKLVLLAFADAANPDGLCWMAVQSERGKLDIRTKASCSLRALQGHIATLVAEGYLERYDTPGKGAVWRVHSTPANSAGVKGATPANSAGPPASSAGEPLSNLQETEKAERLSPTVDKCPLIGRPLTTGVTLNQWEAFLDMRATIGKPVKAYVATLVLSKLDGIAKAGWHPGDVLDRTTVNMWPDVFEPEEGRVTGVRRLAGGHVAEPVGMSEDDKRELVRIAKIEDFAQQRQERAEFQAKVQRRNGPVPLGQLLGELPLRPPFRKGRD